MAVKLPIVRYEDSRLIYECPACGQKLDVPEAEASLRAVVWNHWEFGPLHRIMVELDRQLDEAIFRTENWLDVVEAMGYERPTWWTSVPPARERLSVEQWAKAWPDHPPDGA